MVDRAGVTLLPELTRALGAPLADVLCAWYAADQLLEAAPARAAAASLEAQIALEDALGQAAALALGLEGRALLDPAHGRRRHAALAELRSRLSADSLPALVRASPVPWIAERSEVPLARALDVWRDLGARTRIHFLLDRLGQVELGDGWSRVGAAALGLEMQRVLAELCQRELASGSGRRGSRGRAELERALAAVDEIAAQLDAGPRSFAPLLVLSQRIRRLC